MDMSGNIKIRGRNKYVLCLCGNIKRFGEVKDLKLVDPTGRGLWQVTSNGRQLTNVYF